METRLKLVLYSCVIFTFCLFGNITAKAEEINTDTYTITFETGSLEVYAPIIVKKGEALKNLPVPEFEGDAYFSGWVSENGELVEDGYIPTSDMTLSMTALCPAVTLDPPEDENEDTYTITFYTGDTEKYAPIKVKKGEAITNLPVPEIEGDGYFSGWVNKNGESVENGYIPTSDITLFMTALCPAVSLNPPADNEENKKSVDETSKKEAGRKEPEPKTPEASPAASQGSTTQNPVITETTSIQKKIVVAEIKGFKVSSGSKKATLTWKAASYANKYQLQVAKDKKMKKNLKKYNVTKTKKVLKLKKGTYYARVRAINGKVCNSWTKVKKIKIKK